MSSARITTLWLILLLISHISWAQDDCGNLSRQENLARYSLRSISRRGSPIHIAGYVTFQDNLAENVRSYWVHAAAKNVSRKGISAWSASIETTGGSGPGLNLTESHDLFFTGDVIEPNEGDAIPSCPKRFVLRTANGEPSRGTADANPSALTVSVRVNFVQFSDGSIWGDPDEAAEAHRLRRETLQKVEFLQQVYSEQGENAFLNALAEPTALPCFERIKTLCGNENRDSSCARKAIQEMTATASRQPKLESH